MRLLDSLAVCAYTYMYNTAICLFLYILLLYIYNIVRLRHIPSPGFPLPIVGHMYLKDATTILKFLAVCRKKCGGVFSFWAGGYPIVVVMDPIAAKQIFVGDGKTFIKGTDYTKKFARVFGQGLVTAIGEKHRLDSSIMHRAFNRINVEKYRHFMREQTTELMNEILLPNDGKEVDVSVFFHVLSLRIFGYFAVGYEYSKDVETAKWINESVSSGSKVLGEHIFYGLPVHPIIPRIRKMLKQISDVTPHFELIISKRIESRRRGEPENSDCLKAMLDSKMQKKDIYEHLVTLLSAGHDTMSYFGCYTALLLAKHPKVQRKIKIELKSVLGDRVDVTADDIKKMKYLPAVMKESLRLYSVIPFVTRIALKDTILQSKNGSSFRVSKGTNCMIPLSIMSRDEAVWENPNEFKPERFINIATFSSAKLGYLPFGHGKRECIGNILAQIEGQTIFALLLQRVTFEEIPGFKPKIDGGISLTTSNGVRVKICVDE